jgi:hypothetical protein
MPGSTASADVNSPNICVSLMLMLAVPPTSMDGDTDTGQESGIRDQESAIRDRESASRAVGE